MGKIFGDRLKSRRKELALTGEVVSLQVGISHTYYYRLERGIREPSDDVVAKLAVALGLPAATLQAWADEDRLGDERSRNLAREVLANDPAALADDYRFPEELSAAAYTGTELGRLVEALSAQDKSERLRLLKALPPGTLAKLRGDILEPGPIPPSAQRSLREDSEDEKIG